MDSPKCGLCPLTRSAIPPEKLIKSAPHHEKPSSPEPQSTQQSSSCSENSVIVTLSGECTLNDTVTPIRLHLRGYFTNVLQKNKQTRSRPIDKRKVKPQFYGEALTVDEVFKRMEEDEKEKKATAEEKKKAAEKRKRAANSEDITDLSEEADDSEAESDDGMCEECEVRYADDDEEMKMCWMGCDSCIRWFHCHCVNLSEIPTGFWSCRYCS